MRIAVEENGLFLEAEVTPEGSVRLLSLSSVPWEPKESDGAFRIVELQEPGNHTGARLDSALRYVDHSISRTCHGSLLEIRQAGLGLLVTSGFLFFDGIPVVRCRTVVENQSEEDHPLESISSFALTGLFSDSSLPPHDFLESEDSIESPNLLHIPRNTWREEAQWETKALKRIRLSSTGSWPASDYLPMGSCENTALGRTYTWQIETAASWCWEAEDREGRLSLRISGPSYQGSGFLQILKPGETFVTVTCAVACVNGGLEESIQALTNYRRCIRRENADNAHPSVIFNDYRSSPLQSFTTEKLLSSIDAAAEAGCRYYCLDCGWHETGIWWDGAEKLLPDGARFLREMREPLGYIRKKGMVPGVWLEPEVMSSDCPLAKKAPKEWFFYRTGRPFYSRGRYQLDFRNPEVLLYTDAIIKCLVEDGGVGYIKMDYNLNIIGTKWNSHSMEDGLLRHTMAYVEWLDALSARYPSLVMENCASGGMRMEYSLLSRMSLQSVTDQSDYLKIAVIACNCPTAVTPEQAAIQSNLLMEGGQEETVFQMVNAILLRISISGFLPALSPERLALVREAIAYHRGICERLKNGVPFWPIGLGDFSKEFLCLGIDCGDTRYLAVWCPGALGGSVTLPIQTDGPGIEVRCAYPEKRPVPFSWDAESATLTVELKPGTARIFELRCFFQGS